MNSLEVRAGQAARLWAKGDAAMAAADHAQAYSLYTQAHDLIMDSPRLHLQAHRKLGSVTRFHANRWEYYTDVGLVFLAPAGVFHLIALVLRLKAALSPARAAAQ